MGGLFVKYCIKNCVNLMQINVFMLLIIHIAQNVHRASTMPQIRFGPAIGQLKCVYLA